MKAAIVVFPGSNRERDAEAALTQAMGKKPVLVWHRDTELPDVDLVLVPGGFSYGDYLRCGAIAAHSPIMREVKARADKGMAGHRRLQRLPDPHRGGIAARRPACATPASSSSAGTCG